MSTSDKTETAIRQLFVESGEKERLMQMLRLRLTEIGWTDALSAHCRETVQKKNTDSITFEDLFEEASGYATVQESIKIDMLEKIKRFIDDHVD